MSLMRALLCGCLVVTGLKVHDKDAAQSVTVSPLETNVVIDGQESLKKYPNFKELSADPSVEDKRLNVIYDGNDKTFADGLFVNLHGESFDSFKMGGINNLLPSPSGDHSEGSEVVELRSNNSYTGGLTVLVMQTKIREVSFGNHGDVYYGDFGAAVMRAEVGQFHLGFRNDKFHARQRIAVLHSTVGDIRVGFSECEFLGGLFIGVNSAKIGDISLNGKFDGGHEIDVESSNAGDFCFGDSDSVFTGGFSVQVNSTKFQNMSLQGTFRDGQRIAVESDEFKIISVGDANSIFEGGLGLSVNSGSFRSVIFDGKVEGDLTIVMSGSQLGPIECVKSSDVNGRVRFVVTDPEFHFDNVARIDENALFERYFNTNIANCRASGGEVLVVNGHEFVRNLTDLSSSHIPKEMTSHQQTVNSVCTEIAIQVAARRRQEGHTKHITVEGTEIKSFEMAGTRNVYQQRQTVILASDKALAGLQKYLQVQTKLMYKHFRRMSQQT